MSLKDLLCRLTSRRNVPSMLHQANQPEPSLEGLPDFVEPLVGWRAWKIWASATNPDGCPSFSSVILDVPWAPRRRFTAEHSFDLGTRCRGLLDRDCSCGVYAFNGPVEALNYLMSVRDRLLGRLVDVAVGTVSLWGKVIECERGFKAQYAYPLHLYLPASFARFVSTVSSTFGVSTGIYASVTEEEIRLTISSGYKGPRSRKLCLKNSASITARDFPYEVGFYDLVPSRGQRYRSATAGSGLSLHASEFPVDPLDI